MQKPHEPHASGDVETDHDYDGIREFDNPLPRWWLWTFALTVVFSIFYWLTRHSLKADGTFAEFTSELEAFESRMAANAVAPETLVAMAADPQAVARGKVTFGNKCASCHGEDAAGGSGPNLTDRFWLHGREARELYVSVSGGFPKLGMPKWRNQLEDTAIQEVVAFVLSVRDTNVPGKGPQGVEVN
jgi:cytochrome c oxidase cbb3-type subunit 3